MKGVLVLEVDIDSDADIQGWVNEVMDFAFPKDSDAEPGDPAFVALHVAVREDAEMILDVFRTPELGGGEHFVVFNADGAWVIEHSLRCRRTGQMTECPYIEAVRISMFRDIDTSPARYRLMGIRDVRSDDESWVNYELVP